MWTITENFSPIKIEVSESQKIKMHGYTIEIIILRDNFKLKVCEEKNKILSDDGGRAVRIELPVYRNQATECKET